MADDDQTQVDDLGNPIDTSAAPTPEPQAGIPEPENDAQRQAKTVLKAASEGRDINEDPLERAAGRSPLNQLGDKLGISKKVGGLQEAIRDETKENPEGAGIVQQGSSALRGIYNYLTGQDAASKQDLTGAIQKVNPNGNLDDNVALHAAIAAEQDPYKKDALMSRAMHTAREARALARNAADSNHWDTADALVNEGLKYLPDGTKAEFTRHNSGVTATISHLGSDKSDVINLTPQQYSSWLHSDSSDPDHIMRGNGGIVESLNRAAKQQRADAGPSAPSQAQMRDTQRLGPGDTPTGSEDVGPRYGPTKEQIAPDPRYAAQEPGSSAPPTVQFDGPDRYNRSYDQRVKDTTRRAQMWDEAAAGRAGPEPYRAGDNVMAQREQDLRDRAEERKIGSHVAPGMQEHSNEIAGQVLDTQLGRYRDMEDARRQLSEGKSVDMGRFGNAGRREDYIHQAEKAVENIRRDKDGNLWTQTPGGKVVPYNAQAADQQSHDLRINPGVIPRSVASELGAKERAQYDRGLDERARTSQAAAQEKIRRGGTYDAFDANMAKYGNRLGSPEDIERTNQYLPGSNSGGEEQPQQPTKRFARQPRRRRRPPSQQ
jgi:hypothetical protein